MKKFMAAVPLAALAIASACGDESPTGLAERDFPVPTTPVFDDISNDLDLSIDAVAEVMPLTLGGASGTTQLYVTPRNGDGKNGCNLTGSTTLVVTVFSANTSVATVSPSSVTFGSCGDEHLLTVTPVGEGSTTISLAQTSNTTEGTFELAPATFTVNVSGPPNTAPAVSITGVTGGASYEIGSVPAAICNVVDAEDGNSNFPATLSAITGPLAGYGLGEQTASCSYTDGGGLMASASMGYSIVDTTDPAIAFVSRTPAANGNGWNNSDVTVTWSCTDTGSGVVDAGVSETLTTEGANQSATGTCTDQAGNTASDTQTGINIDKTAPTANASASPGANGNGWNNTNVTVTFSGTDGLSGIEGCTAAVVLSSEGTGQSASGTCTDNAGNVSSTATASGINIDKTAPTDLAFVGGPDDGGSYYWGSVPAAPTCTADGAISGLASCAISGYGTAVGQYTMTATAMDNAGNQSTANRSYTVLAWTLTGFYRPVNMEAWNTAKGGSTVPLKFEIFAGAHGSNEQTSVAAVKSFVVQKINCSAPAEVFTTDPIEEYATGGTSLRYDWTEGQFIQNWKTPKAPNTCYKVTMTAQDDSDIYAYFSLK